MNSKELWAFLFLVGTLLFNWPFLNIFNMSLPYYLFGLWGIFIALVAFLVSANKKRRDTKDV